MDPQETISGVLETVEQLREDHEVPESVQLRLEEIEHVLREDIDVELRVDRVQEIIQELDENQKLPNTVRAQLWNVDAMLELL